MFQHALAIGRQRHGYTQHSRVASLTMNLMHKRDFGHQSTFLARIEGSDIGTAPHGGLPLGWVHKVYIARTPSLGAAFV